MVEFGLAPQRFVAPRKDVHFAPKRVVLSMDEPDSPRARATILCIMKLHATTTQQYQTITAYEETWVEINARRYEHSLLVLPEVVPATWSVVSFETLSPADFAEIEATMPDVVILGTGKRQKFVHPRLIAGLTARRIGVECMDNQAACRTYNILMAEGRKVALALIL